MFQLNKSLQKIGYGPEEKVYKFEGEFIKSAKYYLKNGNALKLIPMSNRCFKLLGVHRKIVEVYAKERVLNPKREADLIAIFKYFAPLQ